MLYRKGSTLRVRLAPPLRTAQTRALCCLLQKGVRATAKVRLEASTEIPVGKDAPSLKVDLEDRDAFYLKIHHPDGGCRLLSVIVGPRGGIRVTQGFKIKGGVS